MNGIDPKWVFYLGILITIEQAIGQGTVKLTNVVPDAWAPFIVSWCTLLAFVGNVIMTALAGISSKATGPLIKPVVILAIVLGCTLGTIGDARAQTKPRLTGDPVQDIRNAIGNNQPAGSPLRLTGKPVEDLLDAMDAKLLPDLKYAKALADAAGSKVTSPCYGAWIAIIETRQNAAKNADGTPMDEPDPGIVTKFEKLVELRNALQPESDFMLKCSPVASMVKKDIAGFIGIVLTGGAGLATLVPGL